MGDFIVQEVRLFLESAYFGMLLGASYDMLRILRRVVKHKNFVVYIEDYLFWVVWGVILFALIFNYNDGDVRGYVFVAVTIGGILYEKSFSSFLVKYISLILNKILTFILKKPLKAVKMVLIRMARYLKKGMMRVNGSFSKKKKKETKRRKDRHNGNMHSRNNLRSGNVRKDKGSKKRDRGA